MSQKPKDPELEKVKTLLRRLEELPQDGGASEQMAASDVVRLGGQSEMSSHRPRPTLVEPPPAVRQPPMPPPPPIAEAEPMQPMDEASGNGRRLLIAGAFVVACGVGFVLARQSWDAPTSHVGAKSATLPETGRTSVTTDRSIAPDTRTTIERTPVQPAGGAQPPAAQKRDASAPADARGAETVTRADDKTPPSANKVELVESADVARQGKGPGEIASPLVLTPTAPASSSGVAAPQPEAPAAVVAIPAAPRPPAASPPRQTLPDADSPDEEMMRTLVKQGQAVLGQGQVAPARLLFRRAADLGSGEAAVLLGDTFDPERLKAMGARGVAGDVQEAIRWYEKADELGASAAKARLMALSSR